MNKENDFPEEDNAGRLPSTPPLSGLALSTDKLKGLSQASITVFGKKSWESTADIRPKGDVCLFFEIGSLYITQVILEFIALLLPQRFSAEITDVNYPMQLI